MIMARRWGKLLGNITYFTWQYGVVLRNFGVESSLEGKISRDGGISAARIGVSFLGKGSIQEFYSIRGNTEEGRGEIGVNVGVSGVVRGETEATGETFRNLGGKRRQNEDVADNGMVEDGEPQGNRGETTHSNEEGGLQRTN